MFTDPTILMNSRITSKPDLIGDDAMATDHRIVREHAFVPNLTIMSDMGIVHEKAVRADTCGFVFPGTSAMDGHALSQDGPGADFNTIFAIFCTQNLSATTNNNAWEKFTIFSNMRLTNHRHMTDELYPRIKFGLRADPAKRTD